MSKNFIKENAALAAQLFLLIQPIIFLIYDIELRKLEVVGNHFIEFFTVRRYVRYQMIANDSPQNRSFSFHTERS